MCQVFLCWVYIFLSSFLIGDLFCSLSARLLKYPYAPLHPVLVSFVGFLPLTVGLGFYSLWFPIGALAPHIILVLSLLLLIIGRRNRLAGLFSFGTIPRSMLLVLLAIIFLFLVKSAQEVTTPDSAGYHLPFIKWIENYRVVPGLANVHSRFGFNYQYHLLCAFYGCSFLSGTTIHALNGYLQCTALLYLLSSLRFGRDVVSYRADIARCLVALIIMNMSNAAPSFSPDFPVSAFCLVVFFLVFDKAESKELYWRDGKAAVICILCVTAVLFKISAAPMLLCALFFLIILLRGQQLKRGFVFCLLLAVCIVPYIIRNYYISGYLVYPLYSLDVIDVAWKLPLHKVVYEKEVIRSYALGLPYGKPVSFGASMISWYHYLKNTNSVYIAIVFTLGACILLNLFLLIRMVFRERTAAKYWLPVFVMLYAGLFYWFFNAPDPRFGNGYILPFIAITLAWYAQTVAGSMVVKRLIPLTCVAVLGLVIMQLNGKKLHKVASNFKSSGKWYWIRQAAYPQPDTFIIRENGNVFFKVDSPGFCWESPQPCSYCNDSFRYQGTTVSQGFLPYVPDRK